MPENISLTSNQKMADALLKESETDLQSFLSDSRARQLSYEDTAKELYLKTNGVVSVGYQTIKRWLQDFGLIEKAAS